MRSAVSILLFLMVVSCSTNSSQIKGIWKLEKIDYSEYFKSVPEKVKKFLISKMEIEFKRLKDKTFFNFKPDNQLVLEAPNYSGAQTFTKGSWSLNKEGDSLFLFVTEKERYKILELNSDYMILSTQEIPARTLHLTRE